MAEPLIEEVIAILKASGLDHEYLAVELLVHQRDRLKEILKNMIGPARKVLDDRMEDTICTKPPGYEATLLALSIIEAADAVGQPVLERADHDRRRIES
jgi:hypothetical protein